MFKRIARWLHDFQELTGWLPALLVLTLAGIPYVDRQSVFLSLDFAPPMEITLVAGESRRVTVPIVRRRDPAGGLMTLMSLFKKPGFYAAGIAGATLSDVVSGGRTLWRLRVPAEDVAKAAELAGRITGLGFGRPQIVRD